jgi:methylenetetrahydrofolate dehydrogenase (NADP+)/methenyltetrahydrofolate cyclohydrolase
MPIISGKELSAQIKSQIKEQVEEYKSQGKRLPCLSVILVGDNPASQSYVRSKARACELVGMENRTLILPKDCTQEELMDLIAKENADPNVDGILVQLPLPKHLNEKEAIAAIDPNKDVDGLHEINAGRLFSGQEGFVPCTPKGCMAMLESIGLSDLSGKNAIVLGRSNLVGKPVSMLLMQKNATVTMAHSKTKNIEELCSKADIVIAAMGVPKKVGAEWIKDGAVVIDVGINRTEDGLVGDVDFENVQTKASYITPVPGGVGLMTVAMLLENTLQAYRLHEGGKI